MFNPMPAIADPLDGDKFANSCRFYLNDRGTYLDGIEKENAVVFCRTDNLPELFNRIKDNGHSYILISHNSDHNIDEERYSWKPSNVVWWFAQNMLIDKPNLSPVPIGLERSGVANSGNIDDFIENVRGTWKKNALAYANFANGTNPKRPSIKKYFQESGWCLVEPERIQFRHFLANLRRHKFVISPPGNGWDVHRTWETFYSGSIPVVEKNPENIYFSKILPMVLYENIEEITVDSLNNNYESIREKLMLNAYTLEALTFTWWKNIIHHYAKVML